MAESMQEIAEKTYRAIGRFIFEFSQVEFTIRHFLAEQIKLDDKYFVAVVQSYDAALLCSVAKRVFETELDRPTAETVGNLINAFLKLNEHRQRVAHGLWNPHFDGGSVHHVSRSSLRPKSYDDQADSLEKLADEANQIRSALTDAFYNPPII